MENSILSDISSTALLEQIGDTQFLAWAIKDLDHRFLYVNEAFCKASGCQAHELIGKNDLEAGRPEWLVMGDPATGWPGLWVLDDQAIEGICPTISVDTKSGRELTAETLRTPIHHDDGRIVALLVQLHDVSELQELKRRVDSNLDAISIRDVEITATDAVLVTLMACQDTHSLLTQLAEVLVKRTRADGAFVTTLQEAGEHVEIVAVSGNCPEEMIGTTFTKDEEFMGRAWHANDSLFIENMDTLTSFLSYRPGTQAFSVPLSVDGVTLAALTVTSDPESPELSGDITLLERIGGMASIAIANTHLIDATRRSLKCTHALAQVSQLLPELEDITTACEVVCRLMLPAAEATRASAYLIDANGQLNPLCSLAFRHGKVNRSSTMLPKLTHECIAHWSVANDQTALISRLAEDSRESAAVHAIRARMDIGSTFCVPLRANGLVIGAMLISRSRSKRDFSKADTDLFKTIVNQLSTSIERMNLARELQYQAFHDPLTSLPNRYSFEQELERNTELNNPTAASFSVLFIDLDGFKGVNDSYGHSIGDQLLKLVADRFHSQMGEADILARMGGDEFAALMRQDADGLKTARRLLACLEHEFPIVNDHLNISASIGISRFPENGNSACTLLQGADEAMYQAKRSGKGCVFAYSETLAIQSRERFRLVSQLRAAIAKREFRLVYQPQTRCSDNKVIGLEALIRWQHPDRGWMLPCEFIPVAESAGLINDIGAWVIDEAVRQLALWQSTKAQWVRVSVNIAASQFQQDEFCHQVFDALNRHGVRACALELEVTESVVMQDVPLVAERLKQLRSKGLRIAIDDFGTGYSSLSYLQDLPLDVLKIDRTFVERLATETSQTSLVKTIILLATALGLETVAEGVEQPEQCHTINSLGCNLIQGYLYSRPVLPEDIPATINRIQSLPVDIAERLTPCTGLQ